MSATEPFNGLVVVQGLGVQGLRQKQQQGGALVGKGVYGCTFRPVPRCAGGRIFERVAGRPAVGKVSDTDLGREVRYGRAIMSLPLARNYFAAPIDECKPAMPVEDPESGRCDVLRDAGFFTKFTMAVMPDAGTTLQKWVPADLGRAVANFERLFTHLLEGMVLYQSAGFVHNDVHWGNILVDEKGVARYIDFGLTFRPEEVRVWKDAHFGTGFKPEYIYQAPEIHAFRLYMDRYSLAYGVARLRAKSGEYAALERTFPRRASLEAAMGDVLRTVDQTEEGLAAYLQRYGERVDWWRIGLCMWHMWGDFCRDLPGFRESVLYRDRRDVILRVIGGLTDFDPRARMSPAEALAILTRPGRA
jgi:hypothetical protein